MEKIINFMDALNSVDTSGVEPLIFMSDEVNVLREDVAIDTISKNDALKNAPKKDSDYIRIPKVLNK
jgi:aspartyl-tRNA(Asn)/glutamyl-tRNA(Gln) amidotransferase subunit C